MAPEKISEITGSPPRYLIDEFGNVHSYSRWIEDQQTGDHQDLTDAGLSRKVALQSRQWIHCPICNVYLKEKNLKRHLEK
jgi:hypothetical protein